MTITNTCEKDGTAPAAGGGGGGAACVVDTVGRAADAAGARVGVGVALTSAIRFARCAWTSSSSRTTSVTWPATGAVDVVGLLRSTNSVGMVTTAPAPMIIIAALRTTTFMQRLTRSAG